MKIPSLTGNAERKSTFLFCALLVLYGASVVLVIVTYKEKWIAIQTWTIVFTGIAILWYTWETMRLREAALAQIELQLRPFVVLELQEKKFLVTNVGMGVAVNVRINKITIDKEFEITAMFPESIAVLRPGDARSVQAESFKKGKSAGDFFLTHLNEKYANREIDVRVEFQNVEMKPYSVSERVMPGHLQIKGIS